METNIQMSIFKNIFCLILLSIYSFFNSILTFYSASKADFTFAKLIILVENNIKTKIPITITTFDKGCKLEVWTIRMSATQISIINQDVLILTFTLVKSIVL